MPLPLPRPPTLHFLCAPVCSVRWLMHRLLERLGESSFERIFNQRLGTTPISYLIGIRRRQELLLLLLLPSCGSCAWHSVRPCSCLQSLSHLRNVAVCAGYLLFKEFCEQCDEPVPQLQFYEEVRLYAYSVTDVLRTPTRLADFVSVNRGCCTTSRSRSRCLTCDSIGFDWNAARGAARRGAPLVTARPPLLDMRLERCHAQNC